MELRDYLRILRKRWLLIALLALTGIAGGAVSTLVTTPKYEARTLSFVSVQNGGSISEFAQGTTYAQNVIRSFTEAITSPRVLGAVVSDVRLGLTETSAELAKSVTATATLNTANLEITVQRTDPVQAANIANAITASFQRQASELTRPAPGELSPVVVTVLTPAEVPDAPVVPNAKLNIALGLLVGLALGVGLAILIEVLDTRIRHQDHIAQLTDAPLLGGIVHDKLAPKRPLIVQAEPKSPRAEAFRSLRTSLQFLDVAGGPRAFVITSSVAAEGKSTTAANLAIVMAQSGLKVLLVDADMRSPSLADIFGIEGGVGLSDVLIGRVPAGDAIQAWGQRGLSLLPAGRIPPNPSELLGSRAMASLLVEAEKVFDAILIDAPPLLPVTDAALLARHVRGAIVIAAAGRTHRGSFKAAIDSLANVGARVAGVVITMVPTKGPDAYGYGRYGYGSYGYGVDVHELRQTGHA